LGTNSRSLPLERGKWHRVVRKKFDVVKTPVLILDSDSYGTRRIHEGVASGKESSRNFGMASIERLLNEQECIFFQIKAPLRDHRPRRLGSHRYASDAPPFRNQILQKRVSGPLRISVVSRIRIDTALGIALNEYMPTTKHRKKKNPHSGSTLDDFLKEEGIFEEVQAAALKRVMAMRIADLMEEKEMKKSTLAKRMHTSRAALDRLLDPANPSVTLITLTRAASALGRRVTIELVPK
jgi:antitoxin HicB